MKFYTLVYQLICFSSTALLGNLGARDEKIRDEGHEEMDDETGPPSSVWNIRDLYEHAPNIFLNIHNSYRIKHEVPILELDEEISAYSRSWARQLAKERRLYPSPTREYGENLYSENIAKGFRYPSLIVHNWYREVRFYQNKMQFKDLHLVSNFTQMIWKSTEFMGVGVAYNNYSEVYVVCNYEPPGNILQEFKDNIMEPVYDYSSEYPKIIQDYDFSFDFKYLTIIRLLLINFFLFLIFISLKTDVFRSFIG